MNTDDLSPSNALEDARYITDFLGPTSAPSARRPKPAAQ